MLDGGCVRNCSGSAIYGIFGPLCAPLVFAHAANAQDVLPERHRAPQEWRPVRRITIDHLSIIITIIRTIMITTRPESDVARLCGSMYACAQQSAAIYAVPLRRLVSCLLCSASGLVLLVLLDYVYRDE